MDSNIFKRYIYTVLLIIESALILFPVTFCVAASEFTGKEPKTAGLDTCTDAAAA